MEIHKQQQDYNGKTYIVSNLIHIAEDIKVEDVDIRTINKYDELLNRDYDTVDLVNKIKQIQEVDLSYPILIYRGFVMDGKHRVAKALLEGKKTIKVKYLEELPLPTN